MLHDYPKLFVSWRSPATRLIHPVGRLDFDAAAHRYEFRYIRAADRAAADGFTAFPEFPKLGDVYRSTELFPLFANRVMPASRPGYPSFLDALGLSPEAANPMAVLARTGGARVTDQVELFPVPLPNHDGCYLTHCLLRAVKYMPPAAGERLARLEVGERLYPMPDPQNPADPHAIAVRTADYVVIGFVPAYLTTDLRILKAECPELKLSVEKVNPPPAEAHHRVLCRVVSCWPDGFQPFQSPEFQPVGPTAAP